MKEWEIEELEDQLDKVLMSFSLLREEPGIKENIKAELLETLVVFTDERIKRREEKNGSRG